MASVFVTVYMSVRVGIWRIIRSLLSENLDIFRIVKYNKIIFCKQVVSWTT